MLLMAKQMQCIKAEHYTETQNADKITGLLIYKDHVEAEK